MPRVRPIALLVIAFFAFLFVRFGASMLMDWYWYQEVGYQRVFLTMLRAQSLTAILTGAAVALFVFINTRIAMQGRQFVLLSPKAPLVEVGEISIPARTVRRLASAAAGVAGFLAAMAAGAQWEKVLRYFHAQPFMKADPLLGRDIGFYVFQLPFYSAALGYVFMAIIVSMLACGVIYFLARQISLIRTLVIAPAARTHLLALAALLLLAMAASARLQIYDLMSSQGGLFAGPGYSDVHARIPLARLESIVLAVLALLVAAASTVKIPFAIPASTAIYVLILLARGLYPAAVERFVVRPNEFSLETPFILHNIEATRTAFGLDQIDERELTPEEPLSSSDIQRNSATVKNIRLWDHAPLLDTFGQIQEIRTYYDFVSVDNDRYVIDGKLQQIMLSARELSTSSLPNRNWINEHLSFTHGFGLTLGPVNRVTAEGLPVLLVKDIPPQSEDPTLKVDRPQVYFGELTNNYVIAKTRGGEFDYPVGEENAYHNYEGAGGIPVQSILRRVVFAIGLSSTDILLSGLITPESRVMIHRNLQERIALIAPYLTLDRDPYLVISDGKLHWMQDAYTTSDQYPYAQQVEGVGSYIRNSVKITLDAYEGSVHFYAADSTDPLLKTYASIFKDVYRPLEEMPEGLRKHVRYPEDIFSIQTAVYSTYHMAQPQIFYNKEDQWEIPVLTQGQQSQTIRPYYTIMKLPGETQEEFILMLPFTPRHKDNLAAWMAARSDPGAYGRLVVYLFPKQSLVYGPRQIDARINQDPEISRQVSLWDQRGSQVIHGTLLVIPIEETLIYVRPLYLRAESGKIPELKRVVVAYENQIAMEETLDLSLARIFGMSGQVAAAAPSPEAVPRPEGRAQEAPSEMDRLAREARDTYDRALKAQREGNWALYGQEIERLGGILGQLSRQR